MNNPIAYILVGVPGSGKSTWINNQMFDWNNTVVASTDNHVDQEARRQGKTYNDVWQSTMPAAVQHMAQTVRDAVRDGLNIVWDQTSTAVPARAKKLRMLPRNYRKIAVVFPTPDDKELARRLANRPGKNIPDSVMKQMISGFVMPTKEEGFDEIRVI